MVQEICLDDQVKSSRPKTIDCEAMFQAVEAYSEIIRQAWHLTRQCGSSSLWSQQLRGMIYQNSKRYRIECLFTIRDSLVCFLNFNGISTLMGYLMPCKRTFLLRRLKCSNLDNKAIFNPTCKAEHLWPWS